MNPYPFSALNHFTVPWATGSPLMVVSRAPHRAAPGSSSTEPRTASMLRTNTYENYDQSARYTIGGRRDRHRRLAGMSDLTTASGPPSGTQFGGQPNGAERRVLDPAQPGVTHQAHGDVAGQRDQPDGDLDEDGERQPAGAHVRRARPGRVVQPAAERRQRADQQHPQHQPPERRPEPLVDQPERPPRQ